jgi:uncharacterized protein DUF1116
VTAHTRSEVAIDDANRSALERVMAAQPVLVGVRRAGDVIPRLGDRDLLHAGPPLAGWPEACGALRGAAAGTLMLADESLEPHAAAAKVSAAPWVLKPGASLNALCTFGGVITTTTPVFVVRDRNSGLETFSAINEGRGLALRYGSTAPETLARLRWLQQEFAEVLDSACAAAGGIELFPLMEQALEMGDDGHSRQKAASALFLAAIAPAVATAAGALTRASRVLAFLGTNDFFFLPLAMAAAKNALVAAEGIAHSTLVTAVAFNGVRGGIRVSGLADWITAPVPPIHGSYFGAYSEADSGPVIGDSEIMETLGLGAFAMAGAPALARYVGGTVDQARAFTDEMYGITLGEHPRLRIAALDRRGVPFGIDVRKVMRSGITPIFSTGIAHRDSGIGQIGAGYGRVPMACFQAAAVALNLELD